MMKRLLTLLISLLIILPLAADAQTLKDGYISADGFVEPFDLNYGLSGSWRLDAASEYISGADTLQTDYGFGGHPAQMFGTSFVADKDGTAEGATYFNGTSWYGRITSYDPTGGSGKYLSAFAWVKGVSQDSGYMFGQYDAGTADRSWMLRPATDKLRVYLSDDGTLDAGHSKRFDTSITVFDNTWHYVGFTWGSGVLKLYVDGVYDSAADKIIDNAITTLNPSTAALTIGSLLVNDVQNLFFTGSIALPCTYNRVVSGDEVAALYRGTRRIMIKDGYILAEGGFVEPYDLDLGLSGSWKLDADSEYISGSDTLQVDYGFGGHPLKMYGTSFVAGHDGTAEGATYFNGATDYGRITNYDPTGGSGKYLSAFCWVKGESQNGCMLGLYDTGATQRSFALRYADDRLVVYLSDDGSLDAGHAKYYKSSIVTGDNIWHLVGLTWDGTLKLYIDGVWDDNPTKLTDAAITALHPSTADLTVGTILDNDVINLPFTGSIALPGTYNRVLSDAEFAALYRDTRRIMIKDGTIQAKGFSETP